MTDDRPNRLGITRVPPDHRPPTFWESLIAGAIVLVILGSVLLALRWIGGS